MNRIERAQQNHQFCSSEYRMVVCIEHEGIEPCCFVPECLTCRTTEYERESGNSPMREEEI